MAKQNRDKHHSHTSVPKQAECKCVESRTGESEEAYPQEEKPVQNNAQIDQMECELQEMQQELAQVQKEREVLENQRKVLKNFPADTSIPGKSLREGWRSDQVMRLQEELENKIAENQTLHGQVARLKAAIEATQRGMDDWETKACELEHKVRCLEGYKNKISESKNKQKDMEAEIQTTMMELRKAQDEVDDLRALIDDQAGHLECYRNKYLLAQQQVEEQKRQMEQMEIDKCRIAEQAQYEMQCMKNDFQERLQKLCPLPDILKNVQAKLQEAQQLRMLAEENCGDLTQELERAKHMNADYENQICKLRNQNEQLMDERTSLKTHIESCEQKCNKLKEDLNKYKQTVSQLEEAMSQGERDQEDKTLTCARLQVEINTIREEANRQRIRERERFDTMRSSLQNQVSELEQELARCRADANMAIRDRDEIQQKLQAQVINITQSFGQTQDRIKNLQNVVDVLRSNVMSCEPEPIEADRCPEKCCD